MTRGFRAMTLFKRSVPRTLGRAARPAKHLLALGMVALALTTGGCIWQSFLSRRDRDTLQRGPESVRDWQRATGSKYDGSLPRR